MKLSVWFNLSRQRALRSDRYSMRLCHINNKTFLYRCGSSCCLAAHGLFFFSFWDLRAFKLYVHIHWAILSVKLMWFWESTNYRTQTRIHTHTVAHSTRRQCNRNLNVQAYNNKVHIDAHTGPVQIIYYAFVSFAMRDAVNEKCAHKWNDEVKKNYNRLPSLTWMYILFNYFHSHLMTWSI